jgi:hypothetical protein
MNKAFTKEADGDDDDDDGAGAAAAAGGHAQLHHARQGYRGCARS